MVFVNYGTLAFEAEGRGFESLRARHLLLGPARRHGLHNVPDTWVTPFQVGLDRFSLRFVLVLEVMPPDKIRSTSSVLRNFSAMIQGRPSLVSFELWGRMGSRAVRTLESPDRSIPDHNP